MSACMFGSPYATLSDPIGISSQSASNPYGALFGGVQAGWEYVFPSRLMLGIEADISFPNYEEPRRSCPTGPPRPAMPARNTSGWHRCAGASATTSAPGRPYLTGGIAWMSTRYSRIDLTTGNEDANPANIRVGWTCWAPASTTASIRRWSARAEYLYTKLQSLRLRLRLRPGALRHAIRPSPRALRTELPLRRGRGEEDQERSRPGQSSNFMARPCSSTRAIRRSTHRMTAPTACRPPARAAQTWGTVGLPRRAPVGGRRVLLQPRAAAGLRRRADHRRRRLPQRRGAARLPLPALQHLAPVRAPDLRAGRRAREGRERPRPARAANATSRASPSRRANSPCRTSSTTTRTPTIRASISSTGRSVVGRRVRLSGRQRRLQLGHHRRAEPADWAVRGGLFLVANQPSTDVYDLAVLSRNGVVGELEMRYRPFDRAGTTRLGVWATTAFTGGYADAVALANLNPSLSANDTIASTRQTRTKYGFYFSIDQEITDSTRRLRPLQLERRAQRNPGLHRHRRQHLGRHVPSREIRGTGPATRSASAAPSTRSRPATPPTWRPAGSA